MMVWWFFPLAWLLAALALLFPYRHWLLGAWREPCWRRLVVVVESDDWGAGPRAQAEALDALRQVLADLRDRDGRPPVVTLGVVLDSADGEVWRSHREFSPAPLTDTVREAFLRGGDAGLFHLQLHGACHFWPAALVAAAQGDPAVDAWLAAAPEAPTEALPDALQSRWIDGSRLPAGLLPTRTLEAAAEEEARAYLRGLGEPPRVAVPTTFIWGEAAERGWARAGVRVVVTPGRRFDARDSAGRPVGPPRPLFNGQRGAEGILYLVRDLYFEPRRGHRPEGLWEDLGRKRRQRRPALMETHRYNFLDPADRPASLGALRVLFVGVLGRFPEVAFLSPQVMGEILARGDPQWLDGSFRVRLAAWWHRIEGVPGLDRRLRLSGLAWILGPLARHMEGVS